MTDIRVRPHANDSNNLRDKQTNFLHMLSTIGDITFAQMFP